MRRDPDPFAAVHILVGNGGLRSQRQTSRCVSACARVESTFLPVLGVQPALGRNFTPEEDLPGVPPVALISHGCGRAASAADRGAVGRRIAVDGQPVLVIGVLPPRISNCPPWTAPTC